MAAQLVSALTDSMAEQIRIAANGATLNFTTAAGGGGSTVVAWATSGVAMSRSGSVVSLTSSPQLSDAATGGTVAGFSFVGVATGDVPGDFSMSPTTMSAGQQVNLNTLTFQVLATLV